VVGPFLVGRLLPQGVVGSRLTRSAVSATTHNISTAAARPSDFGAGNFNFLDILLITMTIMLATVEQHW
jgi:hypothetical protein